MAAASPSASSIPDACVRRVREDWGLARKCGWSLLRVAGHDRVDFLHSLLSQDLKGLEPGQGAVSGFLDRKGHLKTELLIHVTESEILILVPSLNAQSLRDGLLGFRIMEQVEVEMVDRWSLWLLSGPASTECLRSWGMTGIGEGWPLGHGRWLDVESHTGRVVRARRTGELDFFVAIPEEAAPGLLAELPSPADEREITPRALEILRVEAGLPAAPNEIDGDRLPQELDLDDAVSLTKGCFLGQETMARLTHQGQLRKQLAGWVLEDDDRARPGAVWKDGDRVGKVTTLLRGSAVSGTLGLGILRLSARDSEGTYRFGSPDGAQGRLVDLPFVRGSGFDVDPRRWR